MSKKLAILAFWLLAPVWTVSCLSSASDAGSIAAPFGYQVWRNHLATLAQRVSSGLQAGPAGSEAVPDDTQVEEYFALSEQVSRLEREVRAVQAQSIQTMAALGQQVDWARQRRDFLKGPVEAVLARQVGEGLSQAGLVVALGPEGPNLFFPPSQFFLLKPPLVLVTSPRDRIELSGGYLLGIDLPQTTVEDLERRAEVQGNSALVERTGGLGLYPAWVSEGQSLSDTLETAAHEWAHAYLSLFFPLGRAYFQDYRMRTINETVADMIGKEVAEEVYRRHYSALGLPTPSAALKERQADFARHMRRIRTAVEGMLAQGQVEEAEAYMEAERQQLVARGYPLRRLNQAYLALHSAYADEEGFESPLGTALKEMRRQSPSLGEFVRRIGYISSYGGLQKLLEEAGLGQ